MSKEKTDQQKQEKSCTPSRETKTVSLYNNLCKKFVEK